MTETLTPQSEEQRENYKRFVRLAERLEKLMSHSWGLRVRRDEAALKVAQLKGALVMAEAEFDAAEKAVTDDRELSRPVGEFILASMEDVPHWNNNVGAARTKEEA